MVTVIAACRPCWVPLQAYLEVKVRWPNGGGVSQMFIDRASIFRFMQQAHVLAHEQGNVQEILEFHVAVALRGWKGRAASSPS